MIRILTLLLLFSFKSYAFLPIATDSRIKTLIYSPTEVFRLKFHHHFQSYIEFPEYEKFRIISVGDKYAWDIQQVDNRLFIRPKQAGALTNMTIITSERPYHFELFSSDKNIDFTDAALVYVARFYYPETDYDFMQTVRIKKPLRQHNLKDVNEVLLAREGEDEFSDDPRIINAEQSDIYNYNYSMVGEDVEITPAKIYDDGINTYFEFSSNILPDIYFVDREGKESLAQYSVNEGLVTVKGTNWQFSLRNNKNIVCIFNESENDLKVEK